LACGYNTPLGPIIQYIQKNVRGIKKIAAERGKKKRKKGKNGNKNQGLVAYHETTTSLVR